MDKHDYWGWLEERDLYWLAGLLEGEGYFKAGFPSEPNKPRIVVSMTDEDVVRKVADLWSVSYHRLNRSKKEEHSTAYQVMLTHRPAIELMKKVYPLMGTRRQEQIDKVLASYQPPTRMRTRRRRKKAISE